MWTPDIVLYNSAGDGEQGREMRTLIQVRAHVFAHCRCTDFAGKKFKSCWNSCQAFYPVLFSLMLWGLFEKEQFFNLRWPTMGMWLCSPRQSTWASALKVRWNHRKIKSPIFRILTTTVVASIEGSERPLSVYISLRFKPFFFFISFPFCFENHLSPFCALPRQGKQKIKLQ